MNFLVVGSGAREHIIAEKLAESGSTVYSVLTNLNPGLLKLSTGYHSVTAYNSRNSQTSILDFAKANSVHCVVIGPEDPLANGMADMFWKHDIPVVGPTRQLAQIETSKGFTRDLLEKYDINVSPRYKRFKTMNGASEFIDDLGGDYVIKFDGLMGGKGVKVTGEHLHSKEEALTYCKQLVDGSGTYIIEEKIFGEEFSLMSFCDGRRLAHMPAVQDHKRAYEGDVGPNTGGMGSYSDSNHSLPFLTEQDISDAQEINERVFHALIDETGQGYKGILYGGFMITGDGIKLIEYNARFGDPEAMNLLTLLDDDFSEICYNIAQGKLGTVTFRNESSVCKYIVPKGYGSNPRKDATLIVNSDYARTASLYYAAVNQIDGQITTTSSRAAAIVSSSLTIVEAEKNCERGLQFITGDNIYIRHDIAKPDLINKRIKNMERIR
jgi:fusion protein PurCD|tara:strand:+ start:987 stop:2300 length:1314 start_codon:yes stop_codon:yes gene_type:complete